MKMSRPSQTVVSSNETILLKSHKLCRTFHVEGNSEIRFGKVTFKSSSLIGRTYGSTFQVINGEVCDVDDDTNVVDVGINVGDVNELDNRNISDRADSQRLNQHDIQVMRREGISGNEIISKLVENSSTFSDKTGFAKSKYLKKKRQKHLVYIQLLRPSVRLVHQMLYNQSPTKVCNVRWDMLASILTHTNIQYGSKVMVVDTCQGVVVASVLERLGGEGVCLHLHPGDVSQREVFSMLNVSAATLEPLHCLPWSQIGRVREMSGLEPADITTNNIPQTASPHHRFINDTAASRMKRKRDNDATAELGDCDEVDRTKRVKVEKDLEMISKKEMNRQTRLEDNDTARMLMKEMDFDSLIVVCRYHPTNLVLHLIDFLAPSRHFAVFSPYREVLLDTFSKLRDRGRVVFLKISENWCREYQMLKDRSHPAINMNSSSGFLLTGINVKSLRKDATSSPPILSPPAQTSSPPTCTPPTSAPPASPPPVPTLSQTSSPPAQTSSPPASTLSPPIQTSSPPAP